MKHWFQLNSFYSRVLTYKTMKDHSRTKQQVRKGGRKGEAKSQKLSWFLSLLTRGPVDLNTLTFTPAPSGQKKERACFQGESGSHSLYAHLLSLLPPDKYTTISHHYRIVLTQHKKFQPLKCSNDKSLHGSSEKYAVVPHIASSTLAACLQTLISSWRHKNKTQKSYDVTARAHQGFQHDSWSSKIIDIIIHQGRTAREQHISATEYQDPRLGRNLVETFHSDALHGENKAKKDRGKERRRHSRKHKEKTKEKLQKKYLLIATVSEPGWQKLEEEPAVGWGRRKERLRR